MARRFLAVIILLFVDFYPFLQMILLMGVSTIEVTYSVSSLPFKSK